MLSFREKLRLKKKVEQILEKLPFYFRASSIEELLSKKNIVFIVSGTVLYVREYYKDIRKKESLEAAFIISKHTPIALTYIEEKLKEKKYEMVKNNLRLYVRKKS